MDHHHIGNEQLTLSKIQEILEKKTLLKLSDKSIKQIQSCRNYLDKKLAASTEPIYGINTGFGSLCDVQISDDEIRQLQTNLLMSHACGMGDEVPAVIVRLMLLLKIQSLSYGYSGVSVETVQRLVDFYNFDILPIVYQLGSLGASGDLAPLSHLCLPLLGLSEVHYKGRRMPALFALKQESLEPLSLKSKEGLALINGTQFSAAYAVWGCIEGRKLYHVANQTAALSLDAFDCRISPFFAPLHDIRPHKGQIKTSADIRTLLEDSEIIKQPKTAVQDPYAFRCIPQVHGASYDALLHIEYMVETEINSVTDNPTIFEKEDEIISGGNFHAQPLALPLDYLAIAISELGSISERRTFQLISGKRNLPPFLIKNAGLNSGFMIPQYTAASIASQNKQLCTPASVDSIVSSNGQEDHVSMAANAGTKAYKVVENVWRILAIEWFNAAQALELRRPAKTSSILEMLMEQYRKKVHVITEDRILASDMVNTVTFLKENVKVF